MKLCVVSASRADAGIYMPLLAAIEQQPDLHLAAIKKLADWVIVLGDTWPMLEAAIEAAKLNIPVAHIHGGDVTGSIDNAIRNAITRFAALHFPALPEHATRLERMGEEAWRIHVVGPLGIYAMPEAGYIMPEVVRTRLGLDDRPIILVIQHPVSYEAVEAGAQMRETLEAVNDPAWQPVVIYPNSEPGSAAMIEQIERYPYAKFKNLPYLTFISLLRISDCIVGNSSCGLVEAPLFGVPCVNVGSRQYGRESGERDDVMSIANEINNAILSVFSGMFTSYNYNPYVGYSNGPQRIINVLRETPVDRRLLEKRLTY